MNRYELSPVTNEVAWAAYDRLVADYRITYESEEPMGLEALWRDYATRTTASPNLWMDSYLAAFARAGGYRFVTADGAFRQYSGLDLHLLTDA
jgi:predicted nucleic acid-binding protein